jgi:hypothetical protein
MAPNSWNLRVTEKRRSKACDPGFYQSFKSRFELALRPRAIAIAVNKLTKCIRLGEVMKTIIPCLAILAFSSSVQAQSSKGQFTINGKPLALSHVAAFRIRDQSNARQFETYVMEVLKHSIVLRHVEHTGINRHNAPLMPAFGLNDVGSMRQKTGVEG